ncbi:hypothetical protein F5B21DRAFT_480745 [Xylaria acuta]|nr:hypothetical protein F5B21DRAFT_480745 [Xylaria acuta]
MHSSGVIHCDIVPHNFLLDENLSLKIIDFSGSSLDGSRAVVRPGVRYRAPDPDWKPGKPVTLKEDLFSLGSTVCLIMISNAGFLNGDVDLVNKLRRAKMSI